MFHHRLTKRFIWTVGGLLIFAAIIVFLSTRSYPARVVLGGKVYEVEVVDTQYLLSRGLSGKESLRSDEGMFFVFQTPDKYGFWMKDMLFPIDIIWFDENFRVVHVENNVGPETYPNIFTPKSNSSYVLEISAGEAKKLSIQIGSQARFWKKSD
jgi:uncharacterized protein